MSSGNLLASARGGCQHFKTAIHLCACGCKEQVVTPLNKVTGWVLTEGPTLNPSIGNQNFKCKSHYFINEGNVLFLPN